MSLELLWYLIFLLFLLPLLAKDRELNYRIEPSSSSSTLTKNIGCKLNKKQIIINILQNAFMCAIVATQAASDLADRFCDPNLFFYVDTS